LRFVSNYFNPSVHPAGKYDVRHGIDVIAFVPGKAPPIPGARVTLEVQAAFRARSLARLNAGNVKAARMAMMAITISNSISVKA
jgi:hypothetical protein